LNSPKYTIGNAPLPRHVAIIMDGNGRWAKERDLPRIEGHKKGSDVVREIVECSREVGIEVLTLYAFSEENWNRPKDEVGGLMKLLAEYLISELPRMMKEKIRLNAIGNIEELPGFVKDLIVRTMTVTGKNDAMILNLALSYSARTEIIDALTSIGRLVKEGEIKPEDIDESLFRRHLYTKDLPDPDLLIRTSGENRLSNFLLFQMAYTEIIFISTLWPDFTRKEYLEALEEYAHRERRFGLTSEQIRSESK